MTNPCVKCYNFKEQRISDRNIDDFVYGDSLLLRKKIQENGYCKVWWCSKNQLRKGLITLKTTAYKRKNKGCLFYDGD
jgi:hypothetical protein